MSDVQIHKYKYTDIQIHKYKYTDIQIHKYSLGIKKFCKIEKGGGRVPSESEALNRKGTQTQNCQYPLQKLAFKVQSEFCRILRVVGPRVYSRKSQIWNLSSVFLFNLPMKPPHMPPMAKMETAMAYMKVEDSYVMFTPSERWRCAFLINFSITCKGTD